MPTYSIGEAIREIRLRLGYTQEELAYGICTTGTLSRIENGKEIASKQVFEALCSRMPGLHHVWISCDTKKEMQRSKLSKQILLYLANGELLQAKTAIETYHEIKEKENPFCIQFELYTEAIYQAISGEKEVLKKLKQALEITLPDYKERIRIQKRTVLLTYDEVYIMSNMGIAYAKENELEKAYQMLHFLKEYMEERQLDMTEFFKVYPMILGNLAWLLEQIGQFAEAIKRCDSGIKICQITGRYTVLPHLLCIKAWCFTATANPMIAKKCRQQAKTILDITEQYRGYESFEDFYKAKEPIYVIF